MIAEITDDMGFNLVGTEKVSGLTLAKLIECAKLMDASEYPEGDEGEQWKLGADH